MALKSSPTTWGRRVMPMIICQMSSRSTPPSTIFTPGSSMASCCTSVAPNAQLPSVMPPVSSSCAHEPPPTKRLAAGIEFGRAGAGPGDAPAAMKDRHHDRYVGLVNSAAIGIVEDEHVALVDPGIVGKILDDRIDHRRHGAGMKDDLRAHIHDRTIGEINADVEVCRLGDDGRARDILQRNRLLLGDG